MDPSIAELDLEKMLGLKDLEKANNLKAQQRQKELDAFTAEDSMAIEEKLASLQMESFSVDFDAVQKSSQQNLTKNQDKISSVTDEPIDVPKYSDSNLLNNSEQSAEPIPPKISEENISIVPPPTKIAEETISIVPSPTKIAEKATPKTSKAPPKATVKLMKSKPLSTSKAKSLLSTSSQARKVPESRIGRVVTFTGDET